MGAEAYPAIAKDVSHHVKSMVGISPGARHGARHHCPLAGKAVRVRDLRPKNRPRRRYSSGRTSRAASCSKGSSFCMDAAADVMRPCGHGIQRGHRLAAGVAQGHGQCMDADLMPRWPGNSRRGACSTSARKATHIDRGLGVMRCGAWPFEPGVDCRAGLCRQQHTPCGGGMRGQNVRRRASRRRSRGPMLW